MRGSGTMKRRCGLLLLMQGRCWRPEMAGREKRGGVEKGDAVVG
jgi:hypothetical protein